MADGGSKGKTALPENFHVTDSMRGWARTNCPGVDVIAATAEMIDYARARDWRMKDWEATWRNWIRKAAKASAGRSFHAAPPTAPQPKPQAPREPWPQQDIHRASLNLSMLAAVMSLSGRVAIENLRNAVRERNRMAAQFREMYGDKMSADEWQEMRPKIRRRFREILSGSAPA